MKTYFIAGRNASASPSTKSHGTRSSAMALDSAQGSGANLASDTESDRGEASETKTETQSRKPLLAANANGAGGSGASPEKSGSNGLSGAEEGKEAVQNHAENPSGGDVNGGVVSQPNQSGGEVVQGDDPSEACPLALNFLHHIDEPNSESQLIEFLKQNMDMDYFQKPPINKFSLRFNDAPVEANYHSQFTPDYMQPDRKEGNGEEKPRDRRHSSETISTTRYNTLIDVAIAFSTFIMLGIACFLSFDLSIPWAVLFPVISLLQLVILLAMVREAFCRAIVMACAEYIALLFHNWYRRHVLGALLLSCPALAVFTNFTCNDDTCFGSNRLFFCFLLIASLLHFCNFVQLNVWMKSLLALISGTILLVLLFICNPCPSVSDSTAVPDASENLTTALYEANSSAPMEDSVYDSCNTDFHQFVIPEELILDVILLLILIFILNREYEIGFRLNYFSNYRASQDKIKMQALQTEAEVLLHHIVPEFVTGQLRNTIKYSKNHEKVAVIFCSIVNFNDFYEEAYEGGKECIRVLHELISDFDNLLDVPEFKTVEKIKTIGSTYMAACGLHPSQSNEVGEKSVEQLVTLMEFSNAMFHQLKKFNEDVLSMTIGAFNFILRIGYNHGKLTAGVIGTTKLLYDIWGDTVNVASRMDSTGLPGHIQVTEHSMQALEHHYEFKQRGAVKVRGKGEMLTYLYVGKKENTQADGSQVVINEVKS